mgnify:FL=1
MFNGRKIVVATKHYKESVIAPVLKNHLNLDAFVLTDFDTDQLGTFTGEISREDDSLTTVKRKCLQAMELANCDLGIASEGSFGNHPTIFIAPADDELLVFIDKKNNLEIVAREISLDTNFDQKTCFSVDEVFEFAQNVKFPSHGLILRKNPNDFESIYKGIVHPEHLKVLAEQFLKEQDSIYVETDMRAMYNPTRMLVIQELTKKLIQKIKCLCPNCQTPGFDVVELIKGVPCKQCLQPTESTQYLIKQCKKCDYSEKEKYKPDRKFEDPMYCNYCNP